MNKKSIDRTAAIAAENSGRFATNKNASAGLSGWRF